MIKKYNAHISGIDFDMDLNFSIKLKTAEKMIEEKKDIELMSFIQGVYESNND